MASSTPPEAAASRSVAAERAADPKPMAPGRYRLSVTLSQQGYERLRELQAVLERRSV